MLKQFDIVRIKTTKRIRYLSSPSNNIATPHGNWSIVGFVGQDAIISKEKTLVRVPLSDIEKIASYNIENLFNKIRHYDKNIFSCKNDNVTINVAEYLSDKLNISIDSAMEIVEKYQFDKMVPSIDKCEQISKRVKKLWQRRKN